MAYFWNTANVLAIGLPVIVRADMPPEAHTSPFSSFHANFGKRPLIKTECIRKEEVTIT